MALEFACARGILPRRTLIFGIEGQAFEPGKALSPEVIKTAKLLVQALLKAAASPGNVPVTNARQSGV